MSRARVAEGLLALACVAAVVAPARTLFEPDSWIASALFMAVLVAGTGMVVRAVSRRDTVVVLAQIGVGVLFTSWIFAPAHLWFGLPGRATVLDLNALLYEARMLITYAVPPVKAGAGITLLLALVSWVTMLIVDFIAVTRRSPGVAGIALFAAFLVTASNSGAGMSVWYFVVAAALWLLMLSRAGVRSLHRWDSGSRRGVQTTATPRSTAVRMAMAGRIVTVAAVICAALITALLPHMPTRFLLDGLGRAADGVGGSGAGTITSTVDLAQNLEGQSQQAVLEYTTTATRPAPLRVAILSHYEAGEWSEEEDSVLSDTLFPAEPDDPALQTIDVTSNLVGAPQLAVPYPAVSLSTEASWQSRADGTIIVDRRAEQYSASYLQAEPDEDLLQSVPPGYVGGGGVSGTDLMVDPSSQPHVQRVLRDIISAEMTPIDKARAIQEHLRSSSYTYSLELVETALSPITGEPVEDPLSRFLITRQGFCTQFASAMVMMARSEGIPARFAIGYLPGTAEGDVRTVVGADAHAWPELYFEGAGWLRFEPTPSTRSGLAPAYSVAQRDTANDQPTQAPTPTAGPTVDQHNLPDIADPAFPTSTPVNTSFIQSALDRFGWLAAVLILGLLGALTVPATAWWERRRRRALARSEQERVEVIWRDLLERLDDVGVTPPPDATPRQVGKFIWAETFLSPESRVALRRMVSAVEQARYARPTATLDGTGRDGEDLAQTGTTRAPARVRRVASGHIDSLESDARIISTNVVGSLQRSERTRARWWPTAGVTAWRRLFESGSAELQDRIARLSRRG